MSKTRAPSLRPSAVRPPPGRPKNHLLAALPARDFRRLLPYLTTVPIRVGPLTTLSISLLLLGILLIGIVQEPFLQQIAAAVR